MENKILARPWEDYLMFRKNVWLRRRIYFGTFCQREDKSWDWV